MAGRMKKELTHLDASGRPRMVDVSEKSMTQRMARAEAWVTMSADALNAIREAKIKKGDVLRIAELAGVQGAKRASDLIPLCHPLPLDSVTVIAQIEANGVRIEATVSTHWKTGVEMEALAAVNSAALTVYDMTKSIDKGIVIERVRLLEKRGGRSGDWVASSVE
jgi:cyclic pyranopterin phosphate synthase